MKIGSNNPKAISYNKHQSKSNSDKSITTANTIILSKNKSENSLTSQKRNGESSITKANIKILSKSKSVKSMTREKEKILQKSINGN